MALKGRWIGVVGCSRKKRNRPARVEEFYNSNLFRASVRWCRYNLSGVFVMSAGYGLVTLGTVIRPYDLVVDNENYKDSQSMTGDERAVYGGRVRADITRVARGRGVMCFLTKNYYRLVAGPDTLSFWGVRYGFPHCGEIAKLAMLKANPTFTTGVLERVRGRNL